MSLVLFLSHGFTIAVIIGIVRTGRVREFVLVIIGGSIFVAWIVMLATNGLVRFMKKYKRFFLKEV